MYGDVSPAILTIRNNEITPSQTLINVINISYYRIKIKDLEHQIKNRNDPAQL